VPERVDDLAVTLAPERVLQRVELRRSGADRLLPARVDVVDRA
jgi:hypothetical protein